jgi:plasmid stabilization system protein ParE
MTRRVVLQSNARDDAREAARWYERERHGLGRRFRSELSGAIDRISTNPFQFPELEQGTRRALLRRFPYGVYFVIEDDRVVVRAILHLHRDPDTWKRW